MEWVDDGVVVRVRRSGESGLIVDYFTRQHGRHCGYVRSGKSARGAQTHISQLGAQAQVTWRARLDQHLGTYHSEPLSAYPACFLKDRSRLFALQSVCALLTSLPEREPFPHLYDGFCALLDVMANDQINGQSPDCYLAAMAVFELAFLQELGFGLDLSVCAVTGRKDHLKYLSPRTGRAVTEEGAGAYRDRLFEIPELVFVWHMLCGQNMPLGDVFTLIANMTFCPHGLHQTFLVTGQFIQKFILEPSGAAHADVRALLLRAA